MDAIQPAFRWTADNRPNIATFTLADVDYNPIRLHAMQLTGHLTRPDNPPEATKYLIQPPVSALI